MELARGACLPQLGLLIGLQKDCNWRDFLAHLTHIPYFAIYTDKIPPLLHTRCNHQLYNCMGQLLPLTQHTHIERDNYQTVKGTSAPTLLWILLPSNPSTDTEEFVLFVSNAFPLYQEAISLAFILPTSSLIYPLIPDSASSAYSSAHGMSYPRFYAFELTESESIL